MLSVMPELMMMFDDPKGVGEVAEIFVLPMLMSLELDSRKLPPLDSREEEVLLKVRYALT